MSNAGYGNHDAPPPTANANVKPTGPKPGRAEADEVSPAPPSTETRDRSTPGEGALSGGPQGDEVDPGVG